MQTNYKEIITQIINYIEASIKQDVSLNTLSKEVGVSKFHLDRVFKGLTSKSLIQYVKGRRLTCSLQDLLRTEYKVIDIALEYGFRYEQGYSRAFKQHFGISPSDYRRNKHELTITPKLNPDTLHPFNEAIIIQPQFKIKPRFWVAGIENKIYHTVNLKEALASQLAIDFYHHHMQRIPGVIDKDLYIGLVKYSEDSEVYNYYITGTEVHEESEVLEGIRYYTIHSHQYAVFKYIGFHSAFELDYEKILSIYQYITNKWFSDATLTPKYDFHFERVNLKDCDKNYCEMEIFYPIA